MKKKPPPSYPVSLALTALEVRNALRSRALPELQAVIASLPETHPLRGRLIVAFRVAVDAANALNLALKGRPAGGAYECAIAAEPFEERG